METISRVTHDLRRRCARRARTVRGQCVKGPKFVIGSRLGTDSTVLAGRLLFSAPDVDRTGALVGSVPKRPPMEMISRVTHELRRRYARRARTVRGQCVKGPRFAIGSRLGTDPTVRVGRLPFGFAAVRLIPAHNAKEKGPHIAAQAFDLSPTMVGTAGFEPTTLCPPGRCATRLRYAPMLLVLSPPCSGPTSITGLIEKGFSGAAAAALLPVPSGSA